MPLISPRIIKTYFLQFWILAGVFLIPQTASTQSKAAKEQLRILEDSMLKYTPMILQGAHEQIRYEANEKFLSLMEEALEIEKSFKYPFDSLKTISRLKSDDGLLRVFTWTVPRQDGTYEYFGFVQVYNKKKKSYSLHWLLDKSGEIEKPESQSLDPANWYGAIYYKLLRVQNRTGKSYYTLLGWDGNDRLSNKKIVEVLTLRGTRKIVFGYSLFRGLPNRKMKRVIFEYKKNAVMSLKYEKQNANHNYQTSFKRKKNKRLLLKNALKKKRIPMIVFDRLGPMADGMEGMYQFYVPETNVYDAFIFEKGRWKLVRDVDARNPKQNNPKPKQNRPPEQKIYKPN